MPADGLPGRILSTIAPAKVNWTLEVLGRHEDGYHEIRSVMQTVSLADAVTLSLAPHTVIEIGGPESADVPVEGNLVERALAAFPDRLRARPPAISLTKHIPPAAGLGGGSSDAAATLRLLHRFWRMKDRAALDEAASAIGSDVRFFLRGGIQLASGRGELLQPLPDIPKQWLVIVTPPIVVADKTARLYAELRDLHFTDGAATQRLAERLRAGGRVTSEDYVNVFDSVADVVYPDLERYRRALQRITGSQAFLAGSGPSLFAVIRTEPEREGRWQGEGALSSLGARVWTVRTLSAPEAVTLDYSVSR